MAKTSKVVSAGRKKAMAKKLANRPDLTAEQIEKRRQFKTRAYNICNRCGRPRGYMRKFDMCRICVRENASQGLINGATKSSW